MPPSLKPLQALLQQNDQDAIAALLRALITISSVNLFDDPAAKDTGELEIADYYQTKMDDLGLLTSRRDVIAGWQHLSKSRAFFCTTISNWVEAYRSQTSRMTNTL